MLKVYLTPPQPSRGLQRIAYALQRYAPPTIEVCQFPRNVDLTVIYAIGRRDHIERQCREIVGRGKKYAIVQVCLRSTMSPRVDDWLQSPTPDDDFEGIWLNAHVIWSYYDLDQACVDDGWSLEHDGDSMFHSGQFLHAPLGVDASVFKYGGQAYIPLLYKVVTSGLSRLQESVRECELATAAVGGKMLHLGPRVSGKSHVDCMTNLSDEQLAAYYSVCEFASGLRRTEGFELPAAEALLTGARPVVFDTPDYRWCYREFAEYIREGTRQEVVDQLIDLFRQGARPVTAREREEAAHWFNWERVCGEFWRRCLG